jgi:HD superfamily phosphohydrolase YqeK
MIAGLLHDVTKEEPKEEHFRLFEKYGIPLDENLKNNKNLWHAVSASAAARETFGITDSEIPSAILLVVKFMGSP